MDLGNVWPRTICGKRYTFWRCEQDRLYWCDKPNRVVFISSLFIEWFGSLYIFSRGCIRSIRWRLRFCSIVKFECTGRSLGSGGRTSCICFVGGPDSSGWRRRLVVVCGRFLEAKEHIDNWRTYRNSTSLIFCSRVGIVVVFPVDGDVTGSMVKPSE